MSTATAASRSATAAPVRTELRATLAVALPLAAGNLAQMLMGFTDTVMVGRLGALPLAAAGLGAIMFFTTGAVLQGVLTAVAPLAAHAHGAGDAATVRRVAGAGLVLALLLTVPLLALILLIPAVLGALGYEAALAAEIARFLGAIAWGAPAFLLLGVQRSLLAALGRARAVTVVLVACVLGNAALNWLLIFGHLGLPALGIVGSGYASAINQWLIVAGLGVAMRRLPGVSGRPAWDGAMLRRILRLGLPIGGIMALEFGVFVAASVVMGLLGPDALGANQIVLNWASITFMVPLGLAQAATVRVAHARGADDPAAAWRAARVALGLGIGFMSLSGLVIAAAPRAIVAIYTDLDAPAAQGVVAIALQLLVIAALFQVFDGMQAIAAGALRGYQDTTVPMLLAGLGYWAIGGAGGCLLAFPLGLGPAGLWWGLALGLAVVAALLTLRLRRLAAPPPGG